MNEDLHVLTLNKRDKGLPQWCNDYEVFLDDFRVNCVHKVTTEMDENEFLKVTIVFTPSKIVYTYPEPEDE
jgi:hypothetical protein